MVTPAVIQPFVRRERCKESPLEDVVFLRLVGDFVDFVGLGVVLGAALGAGVEEGALRAMVSLSNERGFG